MGEGLRVREVLAEAVARLGAAGVPDPARDARRLMAAALGIGADRVTLVLADPLPGAEAGRFAEMVAERARFRPVSQITGERLFWGRSFRVTQDVLDPRPETEVLIECALAGPPPTRVLDLGTGSGAILLTLLAEWPGAVGVGSDLSPAALAIAAENARAVGVGERACLVRADWWEGLEAQAPFDLVVSNPPYIAEFEMAGLWPDVRLWEPRGALTPGPTGLEAYARIAVGLGAALVPGGRVLLEIGPAQGAAVSDLLAKAGLGAITVHSDLDGRHRVVEGQHIGSI